MGELDDKITVILGGHEARYVAAQNDNFNGAKAHQNDEITSVEIKTLIAASLEDFAAAVKAGQVKVYDAEGDPSGHYMISLTVIDRLLADKIKELGGEK